VPALARAGELSGRETPGAAHEARARFRRERKKFDARAVRRLTE
jgi:hypothetical protein